MKTSEKTSLSFVNLLLLHPLLTEIVLNERTVQALTEPNAKTPKTLTINPDVTGIETEIATVKDIFHPNHPLSVNLLQQTSVNNRNPLPRLNQVIERNEMDQLMRKRRNQSLKTWSQELLMAQIQRHMWNRTIPKVVRNLAHRKKPDIRGQGRLLKVNVRLKGLRTDRLRVNIPNIDTEARGNVNVLRDRETGKSEKEIY